MAELKSIRGGEVEREAPKRDEHIAELLADLVKRNEAGEIKSIAVAALKQDGGFFDDWVFNRGPESSAAAMIGAVSVLHGDMVENVRSRAAEREDDDGRPA